MPKAEQVYTTPALHPMQAPNPMKKARQRGQVTVPHSFFRNGVDPDAYALTCAGDCMAPAVSDKAVIIASPAAPIRVGHLVVLHRKAGNPLIKRLVVMPPPWPDFSPGSNLAGAVIVDMLNPARRMALHTSELVAIHAVVGVMSPGSLA